MSSHASLPPGDPDRIKIYNWPDAKEEERVTPDTRVVRYMKLETFLWLLNHRVFIPTLNTLKGGDRLEAQISRMWTADFEGKMRPIVAPHKDWLLERAETSIMNGGDEHSRELAELALATQAWLSELGKRRCVWCWNRSNEHLYFMWKTYGDRGVAVVSTVNRIRKALSAVGAEGIVAPVRYVPPYDTVPRADYEAVNSHFHLPYLFKDSGFRPEQEIRFIVKVNPETFPYRPGITLEVNPALIVDKFEVSPHVFSVEAFAVKTFIAEKLWQRRLSPAADTPPTSPSDHFSEETDLPPSLFPELELLGEN
jgi:hypothetical protein